MQQDTGFILKNAECRMQTHSEKLKMTTCIPNISKNCYQFAG